MPPTQEEVPDSITDFVQLLVELRDESAFYHRVSVSTSPTMHALMIAGITEDDNAHILQNPGRVAAAIHDMRRAEPAPLVIECEYDWSALDLEDLARKLERGAEVITSLTADKSQKIIDRYRTMIVPTLRALYEAGVTSDDAAWIRDKDNAARVVRFIRATVGPVEDHDDDDIPLEPGSVPDFR